MSEVQLKKMQRRQARAEMEPVNAAPDKAEEAQVSPLLRQKSGRYASMGKVGQKAGAENTLTSDTILPLSEVQLKKMQRRQTSPRRAETGWFAAFHRE